MRPHPRLRENVRNPTGRGGMAHEARLLLRPPAPTAQEGFPTRLIEPACPSARPILTRYQPARARRRFRKGDLPHFHCLAPQWNPVFLVRNVERVGVQGVRKAITLQEIAAWAVGPARRIWPHSAEWGRACFEQQSGIHSRKPGGMREKCPHERLLERWRGWAGQSVGLRTRNPLPALIRFARTVSGAVRSLSPRHEQRLRRFKGVRTPSARSLDSSGRNPSKGTKWLTNMSMISTCPHHVSKSEPNFDTSIARDRRQPRWPSEVVGRRTRRDHRAVRRM